MKVLVTGATGYVGGLLVPRLLERGHRVRVMVRDPERVAGRPWSPQVEIVRADVEQPATLAAAVDGMEAAYYLVHLMGGGGDFAERDRRAAASFVANAGHLRHVIYLGGLLPEAVKVSKHLASRAEVGEILRAGLPTTEFRAGPVIGAAIFIATNEFFVAQLGSSELNIVATGVLMILVLLFFPDGVIGTLKNRNHLPRFLDWE